MPLEPFTPSSKPGEIYRDDTGALWEVIGYINNPAAILRNVRTDEQHVEVIGCLNADRFTRLVDKA